MSTLMVKHKIAAKKWRYFFSLPAINWRLGQPGHFWQSCERWQANLPPLIGLWAFLLFLLALVLAILSWEGRQYHFLTYLFSPKINAENIIIKGAQYSSLADIERVLGLAAAPKNSADSASDVNLPPIAGDRFAHLSLKKARAKLISLAWIEEASIKKQNHKLLIFLRERVPYALWREEGQLYVMDEKGHILFPAQKMSAQWQESAKIISGKGGNLKAGAFIAKQQAFAKEVKQADISAILERIKAYHFIGERRWDLELDNGLIIKLPEQHPFKRWQEFLLSKEQRDLLAKDITHIDLRLKDRITIAQALPKASHDKLDALAQATRQSDFLPAKRPILKAKPNSRNGEIYGGML